MKTVIFLIVLAIFIAFAFLYEKEEQLKKERYEEIMQALEKRNHLDSLYWEHLENCAFIRKDSVGVGYQGYLYDKYHRVYKIQN